MGFVDPLALVVDRDVEGILTVFPDVGRSESPEPVGLSIGMADTDSVRFLEGPWALMVTSSGFSNLAAMDLGRTLPGRSNALPGAFSFRIGEPSRGIGDPNLEVGVGMADCFTGDGVLCDGVCGEALICLVLRCEESGRRGVWGDHVGA